MVSLAMAGVAGIVGGRSDQCRVIGDQCGRRCVAATVVVGLDGDFGGKCGDLAEGGTPFSRPAAGRSSYAGSGGGLGVVGIFRGNLSLVAGLGFLMH